MFRTGERSPHTSYQSRDTPARPLPLGVYFLGVYLVGEQDGMEWLHPMFLEWNGSNKCLVRGTEPFHFVFGLKNGAILFFVWLENKNEDLFLVTHFSLLVSLPVRGKRDATRGKRDATCGKNRRVARRWKQGGKRLLNRYRRAWKERDAPEPLRSTEMKERGGAESIRNIPILGWLRSGCAWTKRYRN